MNPTNEQLDAMCREATRHCVDRAKALNDAISALLTPCRNCWFREHGGCERERCSCWRVMQEIEHVRDLQRRRRRAKDADYSTMIVDDWNYWIEAKRGNVLFIDAEESEVAE